MRKRFGKLAFICLALVVGLALCGVGYAHWSDTVSIEGTITTGTWCEGCSHGYWKNHPDDWVATPTTQAIFLTTHLGGMPSTQT